MTSLQRKQWGQLLSLTLVHGVSDTYVGLIAPILVPLADHYQVSLPSLIFITTLMAFSANVFQILFGHLRSRYGAPHLLCGGVLTAGLAVLIVLLPCTGPISIVWMALMVFIAGIGVAAVHPEGFRAIHGLTEIPAALTTSIFMVSGFLGFAAGALLASTITQFFGLHAIAWLYLMAPLAAIPLYLTRLRLPIDTDTHTTPQNKTDTIPSVPYLPLFVVASLVAFCSQTQATLLPSYLHKEVGYSLWFSGLSFTLFGIGGGIGSITWSALANRIGHLNILKAATLLGAPMTLLYLLWAPHSAWAAAFLMLTAFFIYASFPFCMTLARYAHSSLRFGQRMGFISGGSWGIAAVLLWCLGPLTTKIGIGPLLHLIWVGYALAAIIAFIAFRRVKTAPSQTPPEPVS